jgi:tetratricopeptide (TPR) repeat protein
MRRIYIIGSCLIGWCSQAVGSDRSLLASPGSSSTSSHASAPSNTDNLGRLIDQANLLVKQKKFLEASKTWEKVTRLLPDSADVHNEYALTLKNLGDLVGAEKEFKTALSCKGDQLGPLFNLSQIYGSEKRWQESADLLKRAAKLDPNAYSYFVHADLGKVDEELGNNNEAVNEYKLALKIDAHKDVALFNLAILYEHMGQTALAIKAWKSYLAVFPTGSRSDEVRKTVEKLSLVGDLGNAEAGDYYDDVTKRGLVRWQVFRPIRVFIASGDGIKGYKVEYSRYISEALDAWTAASDVLKWTPVSSVKDADVVCRWVEKITAQAGVNGSEGGISVVLPSSDDPHSIKSAEVEILTVADGPADPPITDNMIRFVCLHEIGHTLGLKGHSSNPQDVMCFSENSERPVIALSPRDKATLDKLYPKPLQQLHP